MSALQTRELTKHYGELVALAPLNLTVEAGELVALLGRNGAGKTTLLDLISGLLEPSGGEVLVAGAATGSIEARRALSYVADTPALYDDLSLIEHARYIAGLHKSLEWEPRALELMERLWLSDRADDLPSQFSRGLRQKTSLILALIRPFSLLMFDEPFTGLDVGGRATLVELMEEARSNGAAVLVSTHQLDFVEQATRALVLQDGELIFDGPAKDLDAQGLLGGD